MTGKEIHASLREELWATGSMHEAYTGAVARALSVGQGLMHPREVNARAVEAVADEFRRERSLMEPAQFDEWLESQSVAEEDIAPYFRREAAFRRAQQVVAPELLLHLIDHLRAGGEYGALVARAKAKRAILSTLGLSAPELKDVAMTDAELWQWFFCGRLHREVPRSLSSYAHSEHGEVEELLLAVVRECLYLRSSASSAKEP
jgi:hypothetical protein